MYRCKYLIITLFFLFPAVTSAQSSEPDITGLWKGTLYNDSTQRYYRYEIGIGEEKGKLSGFSHTFFLKDDKEFYGVKKVKIKRVDGKVIIEDDGLLANNYPESPAKGVRQLNILTLEIKDSIMILSGPFTTNRTKKYAPLTGTINLQRKNDFWQSALVPHLQELGLSNDLSFVKKENEEKEAQRKKEEETKIVESSISATKTETNPPTVKGNSKKQKDAAKQEETKETVSKENNAIVKSAPAEKQKPEAPRPTEPAAEVAFRKNVVQQTVFFNSDSLQISLYDNGEVDGDTVSVLMNGKVIIAKQGLSTNAVQKTIYAGQDDIELIMYAENLGTIAPNTGLLVVHDGKSIYEIRFSGDLHQNASIILRRRKN